MAGIGEAILDIAMRQAVLDLFQDLGLFERVVAADDAVDQLFGLGRAVTARKRGRELFLDVLFAAHRAGLDRALLEVDHATAAGLDRAAQAGDFLLQPGGGLVPAGQFVFHGGDGLGGLGGQRLVALVERGLRPSEQVGNPALQHVDLAILGIGSLDQAGERRLGGLHRGLGFADFLVDQFERKSVGDPFVRTGLGAGEKGLQGCKHRFTFPRVTVERVNGWIWQL